MLALFVFFLFSYLPLSIHTTIYISKNSIAARFVECFAHLILAWPSWTVKFKARNVCVCISYSTMMCALWKTKINEKKNQRHKQNPKVSIYVFINHIRIELVWKLLTFLLSIECSKIVLVAHGITYEKASCKSTRHRKKRVLLAVANVIGDDTKHFISDSTISLRNAMSNFIYSWFLVCSLSLSIWFDIFRILVLTKLNVCTILDTFNNILLKYFLEKTFHCIGNQN